MDASNNWKYTTPSGLQLLRGYFLLQCFECSLHLVSPQVSSSPSDKFPSLTTESPAPPPQTKERKNSTMLQKGRRTSGGRDFYLKVTFCKNYNNCCPQSTFCHHGVWGAVGFKARATFASIYQFCQCHTPSKMHQSRAATFRRNDFRVPGFLGKTSLLNANVFGYSYAFYI